jgi:hypothetical protein
VLAAVILLCYAPVVLGGRTLVPSLYYPHGVTPDGPWGYDGRRPVNTFNLELSSAAYYESPINALVGRMYRRGTPPLWNPYQGAGLPLLAQYSSRALFPYQIAEDLSPVALWDVFMLGRVWIAGFGTFLFLRAFPLGFASALLGGVLYMLSGTFTWWIGFEQMPNVAMLAPILLFTVRRQLLGRRPTDVVLLAVTVALVLLAGQPEIALYVLLLGTGWGVFVGVSAIPGSKARARAWAEGVGAFALGLALAAPLIAPFLEAMREMVSIHPVGSRMGVQGAIPNQFAIGFFLPTVFEYPIVPRRLPDNGLWDFLGSYVGVTPLALIVPGLVLAFRRRSSPHRAALFFFAAFGAGVLLKNLGWPPFTLIGYLPLFEIAWSPRWAAPVWTLCFAVAAALAFHVLGAWRATRAAPAVAWRWRTLTMLIAVPVGALLCLVFADVVFTRVENATYWLERRPANPPLGEHGEYFWASVLLTIVVAALVLTAIGVITLARRVGTGAWAVALVAVAVAELWYAIPRGYPPEWAALEGVPTLLGLGVAAACAAARWRIAGATAAVALVVILAIDITAPAGMPDRYDPFRRAPYTDFLASHSGHHRMAAADGVLSPNFASALEIQDVRYVAALAVMPMQSYRSQYLHAFPLSPASGDVLWFNGEPFLTVRDARHNGVFDSRVVRRLGDDFRLRLPQYSFLGVKYFVLPKNGDLNADAGATGVRFPLVYDAEVRIYANPAVLPRAFITRQVEQAPTFEAAQRIAATPGFDPRARVVLERPAPAGYDTPAAGAGDAVAITRYEPNRVVVEATAAAAGVLVLTDVHYPGWRASIDGQPAELYRANGLVRAVFVPTGRHVVEFTYAPASFTAGLAIGGVALVVCLGVLVVAPRRAHGPATLTAEHADA